MEELIVARFVLGDRTAYGALYREFQGVALRVAGRILQSASDAEDVVQMAFLKAWTHRASLRDHNAFRPWLLRIVRNLAHTLCNKRRRFTQDAPETHQMVHDSTPYQEVARSRERNDLHQAIQTLSARQCQVITLRVRHDLSFKEIGAQLGCSDGAARVNYLYGVRNLQEKMAA